MKTIKRILPLFVFVSLLISSCGNGSNEAGNNDPGYDSLPGGPAPDNNDATNPSLADTAYNNSDTSNRK